MKCDSCQDKATVFYTQVAEGKLKKFSLCDSCAESKGITSPDGLLMPEEVLGNKASGQGEENLFAALTQQECPVCGFTLENFRKVGRLGCPQCYQAFADEITPRLPGMHRGSTHTGYLPAGLQKQHALESELAELTEKLDHAVREERFEEAASLRDRIQELENQGKDSVTS